MAKDVPKGKWSLWYDVCQVCGTNLIPYKGEGMCERCYMWAYRQAQKLGFISRRIKSQVLRGKQTGKKPRRKRGSEKSEPREPSLTRN